MRSDHPTNDSSLPSFVHPQLAAVAEELGLVWDVWSELKDCKERYLPQENAEPPQAYKNRLKRSQFDSRFKPALKGHAGLLSDFVLTQDVAKSINDNERNIDQQGNDLTTFFTEVDEMVLRDGGCAILTEFSPEPVDGEGNSQIQTAADEALFELRPYLVAIDRRDILNWDVEYRQGKPFINLVTIRERRLVREGLFGTAEKTFYRVLQPGSFQVFELVHSGGKWRADVVEEGTTTLNRVPLVWYSISESKLFQAQPPFLNLARLNIEHLQKRSSLNEVLHKCNLPVPVRKGMVKSLADLIKPIAKLIIGPNSVVDVPTDGDFSFAEPTGNAIASTQGDIVKLEDAMDRVSLAFLSGGEGQKTATEVVLDTAQTQATLKGMARRKASSVEQIFELWTDYTKEKVSGSIEVNEKILQLPPDPQEVQIILDAMGVKISNRLGLTMLLQRRWLPIETDVEAELKLIEGTPSTEVKTPPEQPLASDKDIEEERLAIAA
ncbi:DUF4055 domain-containing protein [Leptolyngbya sp. FACHB-541]|uniref:DUF4055 domain-containing protein n=1 Tax=Leptolyngbya sp. FACHB-541 TaxID=2692810 RepID=UPI00168719EB|nr:DUF4055 domain-containing protein [Leptolyngbya sp. FACHB-541]MBD1995996.1 DUF4055 domain-containing protein [Leptolyngbya sp. FACHB-541]